MSISSIAVPDLGAICRRALGRDVASAEPIGAGGNSRVFRVELDGPDAASPRLVVVKFYRRDAGDRRDRLATEFGSLQFLWQNSVRSIPFPIAIARDRECAIYEYIDGQLAMAGGLASDDIDSAVDFLHLLRQLRSAPGHEAIAAASEARFSLGEIVAGVGERVDRLRRTPAGDGDVEVMRCWIDETFAPLEAEARDWCRREAARARIEFDEPLDPEARTLSPSDFGFHNAIRRPAGTLAFVDFEYFGWDDPAKTIVDFLLHPGMAAVGEGLKRRFAVAMQTAFADVPALAARARLV